MNLRKRIFLSVFLLTSAALADDAYVLPPKGGGVVIPNEPIWLTGIQDSESILSNISGEFPRREESPHFDVANAGFFLNMQHGELQAIYFFQLNIKQPFKRRVYTRTVLENPADAENPITYEHYLAPGEKSTQVVHGPLMNVEANQMYRVSIEVYENRKRTKLIERLTQPVHASFDNSGRCIEPSEQAKPLLLIGVAPDGTDIPTDKLIWPCKI